MDYIDFSLDSRIRKTYVPLTNQQRFLRHVKRITARNLRIPKQFIKEHILPSEEEETENNHLVVNKLQLRFFFTIVYPPAKDCVQCNSQQTPLKNREKCKCDRVLYCSEAISSMSPSWKSFEGFSLCSPSISTFIIRVYFNGLGFEFSKLFLEWQVSLSGLIYVGEEMPKDRRLSSNCLLFGLAEGFYTSVCSVLSNDLLEQLVPPSESIQAPKTLIRDSYQFDTLTKIQMVQYIRQATAAQRAHIKKSLETAVEKSQAKRELVLSVEKLQASIDYLDELVKERKKRIEILSEKVEANENQIFERNNEICHQFQMLKEEKEKIIELRQSRMVDTRFRLEEVCNHLLHRRRVLSKELFYYIYRIIPSPDNSAFSICDIFLPEAQSVDKHDSKMISIALGYVTHLLSIIVLILDVHLSYQICPFGSRSTIIDHHRRCLTAKERILPLYPHTSRPSIFFQHGFYLLNRNISYLRRSLGLKTQSIALTLSNLYTMFTDCLLVDNYNINVDFTLNRFCPYSPSFDHIDPQRLTHPQQAFNQQFLNDIHSIKDNDCMVEVLWKEVEMMTSALVKSENSPTNHSSSNMIRDTSSVTSSMSSGSSSLGSSMENFKQIINKQKQKRKNISDQRLGEITSSIESSYANNQTSSNVGQSSLPKDILRSRRNSSSPAIQTPTRSNNSISNKINDSYSFRHSPRTIQFLNWHRKLRTSSSASSTTNSTNQSSFLFPNISTHDRYSVDFLNQSFDTAIRSKNSPITIVNQQFRSNSLDKGLDRIARSNSRASSISSYSNFGPSHAFIVDHESSQAYLNLEIGPSQPSK